MKTCYRTDAIKNTAKAAGVSVDYVYKILKERKLNSGCNIIPLHVFYQSDEERIFEIVKNIEARDKEVCFRKLLDEVNKNGLLPVYKSDDLLRLLNNLTTRPTMKGNVLREHKQNGRSKPMHVFSQYDKEKKILQIVKNIMTKDKEVCFKKLLETVNKEELFPVYKSDDLRRLLKDLGLTVTTRAAVEANVSKEHKHTNCSKLTCQAKNMPTHAFFQCDKERIIQIVKSIATRDKVVCFRKLLEEVNKDELLPVYKSDDLLRLLKHLGLM